MPEMFLAFDRCVEAQNKCQGCVLATSMHKRPYLWSVLATKILNEHEVCLHIS
jgi:hypothetical protein